MRLKTGNTAPSFETNDMDGRPIQLADFRGQKLLLAFFRYASCPLCNLRISELIRYQPELQMQGLQILAIFQSPLERLQQYAGRQRPPFAMIADPDCRLYRLYGVESSWGGFLKGSLRVGALATAAARGFLPGPMDGDKARIPADFLIGPDLIIHTAYYGNDIGDHLPLPNIHQWLAQTSPIKERD